MKTINKLAAVALTLCVAGTAEAGKGGSSALIQQAVASGSQDAIIAEVERTEGLMCAECIQSVQNLTADNRFAVREVAAWWFAKRPALAGKLAIQFEKDLGTGDSIRVRNAADFLGSIKELKALPQLRSAMNPALSSEAKLALVRAVGYMAHTGGNPVLEAAMVDTDPAVRTASVDAWRDMIHQDGNIGVIEARLADADSTVRAHAATVVGAKHDMNARVSLENLVVNDADPYVRRNAAYALGKLGAAESRAALELASGDKSGIVKGVAKAALASLR